MPYVQVRETASGTYFRAFARIGGKPQQVGRFASEPQALAAAIRAELQANPDAATELGGQLLPKVKPGTVAQAATAWLERQHAQTSATMTMYRTNVTGRTGLVTMPIGKIKLAELLPSDVDEMLALAKAQGMGASSRKNRLKVLGMVLRDAKRNGLVDTVATDDISSERPVRRIGTYLTDAEVEALLEACQDDTQTRLAILLGVDAGLRWEEYSALQTDLVTPDLIFVWRAQERSPRAVVDRTKSWEDRKVPVHTERLRSALVAAIAAAKLKPTGQPAFLLSDADGQPLRYETSRDRLAKVVARAAVENLRGGHDFRHTFASKLHEGQVPLERIRILLGHADLVTTQKYIHHRLDADALELERQALNARH